MRAALALAFLTISCRPPAPAPVIDPRLAAQVPEDASAVVGLNLTVLRASPLYARLPHPFGDAPYVLIAVRGQELLTITPDGHASASRHAPSPLLALAEPLAAKNPVWAVIRGGTALRPVPPTGVRLGLPCRPPGAGRPLGPRCAADPAAGGSR